MNSGQEEKFMARFDGGLSDHAAFLAIRESLTAKLAAAMEQKLIEMGDSAKGISWFSSIADSYVAQKLPKAA